MYHLVFTAHAGECTPLGKSTFCTFS